MYEKKDAYDWLGSAEFRLFDYFRAKPDMKAQEFQDRHDAIQVLVAVMNLNKAFDTLERIKNPIIPVPLGQ